MMDDPLIQRVLSTVIQDSPTPVDNNDETRTERQIDKRFTISALCEVSAHTLIPVVAPMMLFTTISA